MRLSKVNYWFYKLLVNLSAVEELKNKFSSHTSTSLSMTFLFVLLSSFSFSQQKPDTLKITNDIYLLKLSESTYIHVSWHSDPEWGKFTCNGMIVIKNGEAALFDTPMTDSLTRKLVYFIEDSLKSKIKYFVPNHFHSDCTEGMDIMDSLGVKTISSILTKVISIEKHVLTASETFLDTMTINLNGKKIELNYLGEAHSKDNIVVWVEDEKILFGGCMVRALESKSKGNLSDANEKEWPKTLNKVKKKYKEVKIVIPGHGNYGDIELLEHSIELTKEKPKKKRRVYQAKF